MKEYITKILDKSFPEGAEFALGKKDGKDGVKNNQLNYNFNVIWPKKEFIVFKIGYNR